MRIWPACLDSQELIDLSIHKDFSVGPGSKQKSQGPGDPFTFILAGKTGKIFAKVWWLTYQRSA